MTADPSPDPAGFDLIVLDADVDIDQQAWKAPAKDLETLCQKMSTAAFNRVQELGAFDGGGYAAAELAIRLTTDQELQNLNRNYRGFDKPTNVLSFAALDEDHSAAIEGAALYLGDIAIAHETVAREAQEQDKTLNDHLAHLVVHGTLHLLGYDHEDESEAEVMEALERTILAASGIDDPYLAEEQA